MLLELAAFEGLKGAPRLSVEQLAADLTDGHFWCLLAKPCADGAAVAYALGYETYSTWEGRGLYLEDLYVRPEERSLGIGQQLITAVVQRALDHGCARLQWQCLEWNDRALAFYTQRVGATEFTTDGKRWLNLVIKSDEMRALCERGPAT
jgi:GNAT superfamily N-acetyltransferase